MKSIYADNKKFNLGIFSEEVTILNSGTYQVGTEYTPQNPYILGNLFSVFGYWQRSPLYRNQWYSDNEWGFMALVPNIYTNNYAAFLMLEILLRTDIQAVKINKFWTFAIGDE